MLAPRTLRRSSCVIRELHQRGRRASNMVNKYHYEIVQGFFLQDDRNYHEHVQIPVSFGLIDTTANRWQTFTSKIKELNEKASKGTTYKVLIVGRHGQGWHNVCEDKHGRPDWERKWCKLNGDGEIVWGPDPELTPQGIDEAKKVNAVWKKEIPEGMPLPDRFFASPFQRACNTARLTFEGVTEARPLILENLREMMGIHTCDKCSPRSTIAKRFPEFPIEDGFAEEDELWQIDYRETDAEMVVRLRKAMDTIVELTTPDDVYISITAHTGTARALMAAVGHYRYDLPTGGVIPMVVAITEA